MSNSENEPDGFGGVTQHEPHKFAQALEAARDDPDRQDLANMVYGLPGVYELFVDGEDESWRDTTITVGMEDTPGADTAHVMEIMRRAGWKADGVTFAYNRMHFTERDSDE